MPMSAGHMGVSSNPNVPDRFRSFAERYIIARAPEFTKGKELEEGWQAIQDAKKLYQMTAQVSDAEQYQQQTLQQQKEIGESMAKLAALQAQAALPPVSPPIGAANTDPEIMRASQNLAMSMTGDKIPSPTLVRKLYNTLKGRP